MVKLAVDNDWKMGVEIGLGTGKLFNRFLSTKPDLFMVGVDLGIRPDRVALVETIADTYCDRCTVIFFPSVDAAKAVKDDLFDFVFIDAAHSYKAVKKDILAWRNKVKPGGWFGGHDYHPKFEGVKKAVDEAFGDKVGKLDHYIWHVKRWW